MFRVCARVRNLPPVSLMTNDLFLTRESLKGRVLLLDGSDLVETLLNFASGYCRRILDVRDFKTLWESFIKGLLESECQLIAVFEGVNNEFFAATDSKSVSEWNIPAFDYTRLDLPVNTVVAARVLEDLGVPFLFSALCAVPAIVYVAKCFDAIVLSMSSDYEHLDVLCAPLPDLVFSDKPFRCTYNWEKGLKVFNPDLFLRLFGMTTGHLAILRALRVHPSSTPYYNLMAPRHMLELGRDEPEQAVHNIKGRFFKMNSDVFNNDLRKSLKILVTQPSEEKKEELGKCLESKDWEKLWDQVQTAVHGEVYERWKAIWNDCPPWFSERMSDQKTKSKRVMETVLGVRSFPNFYAPPVPEVPDQETVFDLVDTFTKLVASAFGSRLRAGQCLFTIGSNEHGYARKPLDDDAFRDLETLKNGKETLSRLLGLEGTVSSLVQGIERKHRGFALGFAYWATKYPMSVTSRAVFAVLLTYLVDSPNFDEDATKIPVSPHEEESEALSYCLLKFTLVWLDAINALMAKPLPAPEFEKVFCSDNFIVFYDHVSTLEELEDCLKKQCSEEFFSNTGERFLALAAEVSTVLERLRTEAGIDLAKIREMEAAIEEHNAMKPQNCPKWVWERTMDMQKHCRNALKDIFETEGTKCYLRKNKENLLQWYHPAARPVMEAFIKLVVSTSWNLQKSDTFTLERRKKKGNSVVHTFDPKPNVFLDTQGQNANSCLIELLGLDHLRTDLGPVLRRNRLLVLAAYYALMNKESEHEVRLEHCAALVATCVNEPLDVEEWEGERDEFFEAVLSVASWLNAMNKLFPTNLPELGMANDPELFRNQFHVRLKKLRRKRKKMGEDGFLEDFQWGCETGAFEPVLFMKKYLDS